MTPKMVCHVSIGKWSSCSEKNKLLKTGTVVQSWNVQMERLGAHSTVLIFLAYLRTSESHLLQASVIRVYAMDVVLETQATTEIACASKLQYHKVAKS